MSHNRNVSFGSIALATAVVTAGLTPAGVAQTTFRPLNTARGVPPTGLPYFVPGYTPNSYLPFAIAPGSIQYYIPNYGTGVTSLGPITMPQAPAVAYPVVQYPSPQPTGGATDQPGAVAGGAFMPGGERPRVEGGPATAATPAQRSASSTRVTGIAQFTVRLPAAAELWVENQPTRPGGAERRFHSPANLVPGQTYEYRFRARWLENDRWISRERTVNFQAGDNLTVDLSGV
jgi:uncharacterized protein (TIGR03000 family)